jgi:DNA polymerase elongation subunit (family B)
MSYISAFTDRRRDAVIVWERDKDGDRIEQIYDAPYYFYYDDPRGKYKTIYDTPVSKIESKTGREHYTKRKDMVERNIRLWESDIAPEIRVLSNHYYGVPAPKLNVTFLDIEVDTDPDIGFASTRNPYAPINAISLFHTHQNRMVVIAIPPDDGIPWTPELLAAACDDILEVPKTFKTDYILCDNEKDLLLHIIHEIQDSDLLCGWNSETFDFPYIAKRFERVLGEKSLRYLSFPGGEIATFEEIETAYGPAIKLNTCGRMLADYMQLYKKYEPGERASYKLASIEQEVGLGLPKLEYEGSLADLYVNDFAFFVRYNIRDCEILNGFEQKLAYVELANQMYHMSCGLFVHVLGTLKLAELAIVNYCHHELKRVVKNVTEPEIDKSIEGALVLLPQAGMHEYIGSIDINSLYPSAIRSINISPETLRGQFVSDVRDAQEIAKGSSKRITLRLEDGEEYTMTGAEFRVWLKERKWAVSGYGTVFDQKKPGIIPTILADWYAQRKKFQAMKKDAGKKAAEILTKYNAQAIKSKADIEREEERNANNTGMDGMPKY